MNKCVINDYAQLCAVEKRNNERLIKLATWETTLMQRVGGLDKRLTHVRELKEKQRNAIAMWPMQRQNLQRIIQPLFWNMREKKNANKQFYCLVSGCGITKRRFFGARVHVQHTMTRDAGMQRTYIINPILTASPTNLHPPDSKNTFTMTTEITKHSGKYHKLNEYARANRTTDATRRIDVTMRLKMSPVFGPTSALRGGLVKATTPILKAARELQMTMRRPSKNAPLNMRPILVLVEFKFVFYKCALFGWGKVQRGEKMATVVACNNHACGKKVNTSKDYHTCALCKSPVYCSSDCNSIDWPIHACKNTYQVNTPNTLVAVPYFYEDTMSERDLENVSLSDPINSTYSIMYVNTNRDVQQWTVDPVAENEVSDDGRGLKPSGKSYEMEIKYGNAEKRTLKSSAQNDAIYRGNVNNVIANELSGRLGPSKEDAAYVYWPRLGTKHIQTTGPQGLGVRVPFSIKWTADNGNSLSFEGYIPVSKSVPKTARRVQQHLQSKLESKFKNAASSRGARVFRCTDVAGNSAILTTSEDQRTLMDVEVVVRKEPLTPSPRTISRFICNPRDVSEVVGLTMALEKAIADASPAAKNAERVLGPVRNYAHSISSPDEETVSEKRQIPNAVNAAVVSAVDTLFTQVGEPQRVNEYLSKIVRGGPAVARQLATALSAEITKLRDASVLRDYRVGRLSRQIDDLILAVLQMRNSIEQACAESVDIALYNDVLEILQSAKNPLQRNV